MCAVSLTQRNNELMSRVKMCFWVVVLGIVLRFGCHSLLPSSTVITVTSQLPLNTANGHNNLTTEATATIARDEMPPSVSMDISGLFGNNGVEGQDMEKDDEFAGFVNKNIENFRVTWDYYFP
jgi:hypothetical protein